MMPRLAPRQLALAAALGCSLAATAWVASRDEPETAAPAPRRSPNTAKATLALDWPGPSPGERDAWPEADAEARRAWGEVPSPAAMPAAAADTEASPAEAPPFPYQLVGRISDGRPRVVLDGPQRSLLLGVGEVIDSQWRIEAIEAGGLRLKRLPEGPSQFIPFTAP